MHSSYFRKPKTLSPGRRGAQPLWEPRWALPAPLSPAVPPCQPLRAQGTGPLLRAGRPRPLGPPLCACEDNCSLFPLRNSNRTAQPGRQGGGGGRRQQPLSLSNEAAGFGKLPSPFYEEPLYRISQQERNKEISVQLNWRLKLAILKNKSPINTTRIYG